LRDAARNHVPPTDADLLEYCVQTCARIKAGIVERDPYERDRRRVLNLGHTAGHALETTLGHKKMHHGEAVGLGMLTAIRISIQRGNATGDLLNTVTELLAWAKLPTTVPRFPTERFVGAMRLDKKRRKGTLTFVLPHDVEDVRIIDDITTDEILAALPH